MSIEKLLLKQYHLGTVIIHFIINKGAMIELTVAFNHFLGSTQDVECVLI